MNKSYQFWMLRGSLALVVVSRVYINSNKCEMKRNQQILHVNCEIAFYGEMNVM